MRPFFYFSRRPFFIESFFSVTPAAKRPQTDLRCETHFLGWDGALLPRAVDFLYARFASADSFDLGKLICVLPTARGSRRLRFLLQARANESGLTFRPPKVITTGQLAESIYRAPGSIALDFEQTLAWSEVLQSHSADDLLPLLPTLPAAEAINAWMELAGTLRRLHAELASSQLSFSDVVDEAETESEKRRWQLLARLFKKYLNVLNKAGLVDPHWARREAIESSTCSSDHPIVLIGTSDLSDVQLSMLRCVADQTISLIAAPESEAFRFDEFGSVGTDDWLKHELPLLDEQLVSAGDVSDQAVAVAELLADFATQYAADQVTVGVTDESQVGPVELELRGCGVKTYRHLGWTVAETAIGRLFDLTANHLQQGTWQTLAALVRHADMHRFVSEQIAATATKGNQTESDWLIDLDNLLAAHFPLRVADPLPPQAIENGPIAVEVLRIVNELLSGFFADARPIADWSLSIVQWLERLYAEHAVSDPIANDDSDSLDPQWSRLDRTGKAFAKTKSLLNRFSDLNHQLDVAVSGSVAFEMLVGRLAEQRVGDTPEPDDVEILGWLDLALDDAPAMVVMGLNHPFVPGAVTSDPFLPGTLRTRLRMADNNRRYARDVYAMHLLITTRPSVRFVVGRNAADGSPTPPSRLIAAANAVDSARRIRQLLSGSRAAVTIEHCWDTNVAVSQLPIPPLNADPAQIQSLSVTAFRDYLICPYRFYLRHVLRLRPLEDATGELAANQFGDLVHGTLERFGLSADKSLTDQDKIEAALLQHLHEYAEYVYGDGVAMAVKLQVKQAQQRLKFVAAAQAARIAEGWVIDKTEASVKEVATANSAAAGIVVDGKRMGIRGRFDRIDHHPVTNQWAILDYKTHGHKPEKKHLGKVDGRETWVDLQLPLYRMMVPFLGIDAEPANVQLGYFNVSEKDAETGIHIAQFTDEQLSAADELIYQCIRDIWAGRFEPTDDRVQYDDYEMILQTSVPQRLLSEAEQPGFESAEEGS
ncbi:MAG: PD-(D/E)XK nuclease family protein [Pirellulaceae bacterium]|nr:PD-(D/E)XK nuclease family protein [Pirellulaceae bacterium]